MNSDFKDLLRILSEEKVRFLVVGGYAVIHYAQPRYTKDLDIWIEPTAANAHSLMGVFRRFGLPLIGVTEADFAEPKTQFSIGVPPCEIDLLPSIPGLDFEECWDNRALSDQEGISIPYLGKADLITAKETAGRPQDLADLEELQQAE
jgi:hypothetical protein